MVQNKVLLAKLAGTPIPLTRHRRGPVNTRIATAKVPNLLRPDGVGIPLSVESNLNLDLFPSTTTPFSESVSDILVESFPEIQDTVVNIDAYSFDRYAFLLGIYYFLIYAIPQIQILFLVKENPPSKQNNEEFGLAMSGRSSSQGASEILNLKLNDIKKKTEKLLLKNNQSFKTYIESNQNHIYIDFNECCSRLSVHNFRMQKRSKHYFELVKMYKLPNLYNSDFCDINIPEKGINYYQPFYFTKKILEIFSICQTTLALHFLLETESQVFQLKQNSRVSNVMKFALTKVKKHFNISQADDLTKTVQTYNFSVSQPVELLLDVNQNTEPKLVTSVFCITSPITTFLDGAVMVQIVTSFFEGIDLEVPPNQHFPESRNFENKQAAIKKIYNFTQYIGKYFPVLGEKGLIRKLIALRPKSDILPEDIISREKAKYLAKFNGIDPLNYTEHQFNWCLYKNS